MQRTGCTLEMMILIKAAIRDQARPEQILDIKNTIEDIIKERGWV